MELVRKQIFITPSQLSNDLLNSNEPPKRKFYATRLTSFLPERESLKHRILSLN
jgi:hypothetical protein